MGILEPTSAETVEVLARYTNGYYNGKAARSEVGAGTAFYVGIVSDDFEFNQQIESAISMDAGLAFGPRLPYDNFLHIFLNIVQAN